MNVIRNLHRLSTINYTSQYILKSSANLNGAALIKLNNCRQYAKGKDKKKDKKNIKIEINEHLLSSVIDLDLLNNQYQKSLDVMREEFIKNLSLRSTTGSIETLKISVDGKDHELQELAQIVRKNPKTIVVNMISFPQAIPSV